MNTIYCFPGSDSSQILKARFSNFPTVISEGIKTDSKLTDINLRYLSHAQLQESVRKTSCNHKTNQASLFNSLGNVLLGLSNGMLALASTSSAGDVNVAVAMERDSGVSVTFEDVALGRRNAVYAVEKVDGTQERRLVKFGREVKKVKKEDDETK